MKTFYMLSLCLAGIFVGSISNVSQAASPMKARSHHIAPPPTQPTVGGAPQGGWLLNMQNHLKDQRGNVLVGAGVGVGTWLLLTLKDASVGIVIKGGPEFYGLAGLPVCVLLSSTMLAVVGAYKNIDFAAVARQALNPPD